jgi:hypothetical protein
VIDHFIDVGQYTDDDDEGVERLFSPYAKLFDECTLSNAETITVKEL